MNMGWSRRKRRLCTLFKLNRPIDCHAMAKFMNALTLVAKFAVITAILTAASGSMKDVILGTFDSVSINAAHAQMERLHGKLMEYYSLKGRYPQNQNELCEYMQKEFDSPLERILLDPWKTPYYFLTDAYEILCFGPDKQRETRDDIGRSYPEQVTQAWKLQPKRFTPLNLSPPHAPGRR